MGLFSKSKDFDFISIGDIAIDAFIKLKDAQVNCELDNENCRICLRFGDKVPYDYFEEVPAVGNAGNAAVAAARLGLRSALISAIGADGDGEKCKQVFLSENVSLDYLSISKNKCTNYHYVLWYGDDRTILVKHNQFDYRLPQLSKPKWLYLTSLGENSLPFHKEIATYLIRNPEVKLAFQPGTFQIKFGYDKLKAIYERTEILICNLDEAHRILKFPESDKKPIRDLADKIRRLGPKVVLITNGPQGAYAYDGTELLFVPPYPDLKAPLERTGAGDAFSATFIAALALGKNPLEGLRWAPVNAMSVVQQVGAQRGLLTQEQIEAYLAKAPLEYQISKAGNLSVKSE